jgi:cellulose biosynthesis protein BcsQ
MITLLFANHKGGCGKTTHCHHLCEYLSEHGARVLAIDTDTQGNLYRRLARLEHKPVDCPLVEWAPGCHCVLLPDAWCLPKGAERAYDVVLVDTAPGHQLPDGPAPNVVVIPIDGLDAALGASDVVDAVLGGASPAPLVVLLKNGTNEGGKVLQRMVTDLEAGQGIEICAVEVPRGAAIHRTSKTCRPAWQDTYKGSRDAQTILACCAWLGDRVGVS